MSTPPNYDAFQQVFGLSLASNIACTCTDPEAVLQEKIKAKLVHDGYLDQYVGSGWEIVWGPAVWRDKPGSNTPPDNTWFVAKKNALEVGGDTSPVYVVAIAGTTGNFDATYDWKTEDFGVGSVVDLGVWLRQNEGILSKPPPPSEPLRQSQTLISAGTAQGVFVLASNPPAKSPSSDSSTTLCGFLQNLDPPADAKLIFTGHSLGGALSPVLAVALSESKVEYLKKFKNRVFVYPTAGPSPGNQTFVNCFKGLFPASTPGDQPYQVWNKNIVNSLDIVPHAWSTDTSIPLNLHRLPTIWGTPPLLLKLALIILVDLWMCTKPARLGFANIYVPLDASIFEGVMPSNPPKSFNDYQSDAHDQHVFAYIHKILGLSECQIPPILCPSDQKHYVHSSAIGYLGGGVALPDYFSKEERVAIRKGS